MTLATPSSHPVQSDLITANFTSDPAYKKARRQFLKSTRNRPKDIEDQWTPFRAAEKKYKAKFPPPDLSGVLDLALLDEKREGEIRKGHWRGGLEGTNVECLVILPSFISHEEQRALVRWSLRDHARRPNETNLDTHYILPREGLWNAHLHDLHNDGPEQIIQPRASSDSSSTSSPATPSVVSTIVSPPGPRTLISNTPASPSTFQSLTSAEKFPYAPSPTVPPLSTSSLLPKLRWANIGWFYHWGTKQYDFSKGKQEVGNTVRDLCKHAVEGVKWEEVFAGEVSGVASGEGWGDGEQDWHTWTDSYEPDAGIVNFYQTKDTLMGHVDRSEVCATSPLVSISLGNAAVFLIGGLTRDVEPVPVLLRSGDVLIMSGPACRRAYHGVPRILENSLPEHLVHDPSSSSAALNRTEAGDGDWAPFAEYMKTTRINVNVRQVFPKGFDPALDLARAQ